jgi:plastocyanin
MPRRRLATLLFVFVLASACAGETSTETTDERPRSGSRNNSGDTSAAGSAAQSSNSSAPKRVDPRRGGFEIGLGEWAITAESRAIRPGPVTFVLHNRGTMPHGFEIELEGDSSGHGSGELFKAESELLQPGESLRMRMTLDPGVHKIECLVDGHDDMGMEDLLEVRVDAPLVKQKATGDPGKVAIADFAFAPETTEVPVGTEVTWSNDDPAEHTVTADDGAFESNNLAQGETFSFRFDQSGNYPYRCLIHPEMKGVVQVQ